MYKTYVAQPGLPFRTAAEHLVSIVEAINDAPLRERIVSMVEVGSKVVVAVEVED